MHTDRQWNTAMELLINGAAPSDLARVLGFDPGADPKQVVLLLDEAAASRDADRIECAMLLAARTGLTHDAVPSLIALLALPCHEQHEDIVQTLQELKDPRSIDALFAASQVKHAYLDYDELDGLARKCTWALADIGTPDALEKLRSLAKSDNAQIAGYAKKRIDRWEDDARFATLFSAVETEPCCMSDSNDDERFGALFQAAVKKGAVVQRIFIVATILLGLAGLAGGLMLGFFIQGERVYSVVCGFAGVGGAGLGLALGRALRASLLALARPIWRRQLKRAFAATDSEIDDVFGMLG